MADTGRVRELCCGGDQGKHRLERDVCAHAVAVGVVQLGDLSQGVEGQGPVKDAVQDRLLAAVAVEITGCFA